MKGRLLIYTASGEIADPPEVEELADDLAGLTALAQLLDKLRAIVEDDIEQVPTFGSIRLDGKIERCVALVGEHGKLSGKPANERATILWQDAMVREGGAGFLHRRFRDHIVGTMVVLIGDEDFMASL